MSVQEAVQTSAALFMAKLCRHQTQIKFLLISDNCARQHLPLNEFT